MGGIMPVLMATFVTGIELTVTLPPLDPTTASDTNTNGDENKPAAVAISIETQACTIRVRASTAPGDQQTLHVKGEMVAMPAFGSAGDAEDEDEGGGVSEVASVLQWTNGSVVNGTCVVGRSRVE